MNRPNCPHRIPGSSVDFSRYGQGFGRELLANFRAVATTADAGATAITFLPEPPA